MSKTLHKQKRFGFLHYLILFIFGIGILTAINSCSGGGGGGSGGSGGSSSPTTPSTVFTPPDPVTIATQTTPTKPTTVADSTAFLYSGDNAVQRGMTPDTIEDEKAAVIRGKVLDKLNTPLDGVKVTILNHPEYGYTYSRDDGMFDMSVNGGEDLAVNYEKDGYMQLQRTSSIPEQDFTVIDDIVMTKYSTKSSLVDLNQQTQPFSVAQGETQTDARGTRTDTVLFPKNTSAQMVFADGSTQPLSTLHVRATEYTTGDNGPNAMPAELPDGVAYTYCVELSVDEAESAGATGVTFSEPVLNYVENFKGFPVGDIVPTYYYDKEQGKWIRTDDGKVIAIVSITNDLADIDIDDDGVADDVSSLGISDDERKHIATLYQAGTELWRTPISHFSPIDHNWGLPPEVTDPNNEPDMDDLDNEPDEENDCTESGSSVIETHNQVLGESIEVSGTSLNINYSSRNTPGYSPNYTLNIPYKKREGGMQELSTIVDVFIAGKKETGLYIFQDAPDKIHHFEWDGLDAYGRKVYGPQPVTVRLRHNYRAVDLRGQAFLTSTTKSKILYLNANPIKTLGAEGWSLNSYHFYNHNTLYRGDGSKRKVQNINSIISTIAGTREAGYSGDNGQAVDAEFEHINDMEIDKDGNIYIADTGNHVIRKVAPNGIITTIAGTGQDDSYGDGGPANAAALSYPSGISLTADGSIYIADRGNLKIRKIDSDGIITTVAGDGVMHYGVCNDYDGKVATDYCIGAPNRVLALDDGSFYYSSSQYTVNKVGKDGIVRIIAGDPEEGGYSGDGGQARDALMYGPEKIVMASDGSLYVNEVANYIIRKIATNGIISTVAGTGIQGYSGDAGLATEAKLGGSYGLAIDKDDNLYYPDFWYGTIRKIDTNGIISRVAGVVQNDLAYSGDGGDPLLAEIESPDVVALDEDENMYIGNYLSIRKVSSRSATFNNTDSYVLSQNQKEIFHFNKKGKHLETLNAQTGQLIYQFVHNVKGELTQVVDAYNNVVILERDNNGKVTSIISPYGQKTLLSIDASDHLTKVTNPNNESWNLTYTDKGLMTSARKPNLHRSQYTFDDKGMITEAQDATGATKTFVRSEASRSEYSVTRTSAMGYTKEYKMKRLANGDMQWSTVDSSGLESNATINSSGTITKNSPNGTITTSTSQPDKRFAMGTTKPSVNTITTPAGLSQIRTFKQQVVISDADDIMSLISETNTITINDNNYTLRYDNTTKTITSTSPEGRKVITTLNPQGDMIKRVSGNLAAIDYSYDTKGKLTQISQGDIQVSLAYNSNGYVSSVTNPLNKTTSFTYDDAGRITKQTFADSREISYTYDASGNLLSLTPPQKPSHDFIYTLIDKVEKYTPPTVAGTGSTDFSYNLDKQLTKITRPDGQTVDLSYDSAGRLSAVEDINYAYDTTTGNIKTITNGDSETLTFSFDGSLLTQTSLSGTVQGTIAQTFNNDFRVTQQSITSANSIDYTYDRDGLATQVGDMSITRDSANGYITETTLNTISDSRTINNVAQIQDYNVEQSSTPIFSVNYTYDKLSRITQLEETVDGATHTYNYSYDNASRLSDISKDGVNIGTYTYDENGNRLSSNGVNATYDNQDRLQTLGSATYSYTANGELLRKVDGSNITSYTYDLLGNLKSVVLPNNTRIDYLVDGLNRRVGKKTNGTLVQGFLYKDALNPIAELDGSNNIVSQFIYVSKSNVPDYMIKGGTTYRIISDHLGSPRIILNAANGDVVQRMDYDVWGNVTNDTNPGFQPFGFAGGLYDTDTKLTRFGARDYDAQSGRWTAKDPIGLSAGSNVYAYVINNPLNMIDPLGLYGIGGIYLPVEPGADIPNQVMNHQAYVSCRQQYRRQVLRHNAPASRNRDLRRFRNPCSQDLREESEYDIWMRQCMNNYSPYDFELQEREEPSWLERFIDETFGGRNFIHPLSEEGGGGVRA